MMASLELPVLPEQSQTFDNMPWVTRNPRCLSYYNPPGDVGGMNSTDDNKDKNDTTRMSETVQDRLFQKQGHASQINTTILIPNAAHRDIGCRIRL